MVEFGFLPKPKSSTDQVEKLLDFFGVGSASAWEDLCARVCVAYRKSPSFNSAPESVTAWLRMHELLAGEIDSLPYDKGRFVAALNRIRQLSCEPLDVFVPELKNLCAQAGVVVTFAPELPETYLSGAARWLSKDKALIMLSLRHKSDDHLWFTFFHEAGHILLHSKKEVFIDDKKFEEDGIEEQANNFSRNLLIPVKEYSNFISLGRWSSTSIINFANKLGISPGIVVGRLQHDRLIEYSHHNKLKRRFVWT